MCQDPEAAGRADWGNASALMQFTSSLDPGRSDLLQELIKIPPKNNCKMKQIVLSGGQ